MKEQTIFPREEKAEVLFQKILNDHWACEKLQETFCNCLFCNDDSDAGIFLPNSIFLKNLERHVAKAEEIIYGEK